MESVQIKEYMNHYPVTFTPEMVIEEASFRLLKTKQLGGPVVDAAKKLVGYLSESDLLRKMLESSYHHEHIANVADLMQKNVLSVKPYDSIVELAQNMLGDKPKVYPVVDDDGNLLGTISRNDVLMAVDKHLRAAYHLSNQ
ncbi:CBS domain-containing protein [Thalassotalea sp. M1531]|uniref:CBS domain-containing protein n=1 Tax=Thalassotalea algicola TaxID=2716224 RepID=A0A7Y0Q803_9GAMM|nr:CBS domain-containing protein [Thalassotalea algicola]NMP31580.1 CBS domain-containing protein [Thalassotalea algicola]